MNLCRNRVLISIALFACLAGVASADTIISRPGDPVLKPWALGGSQNQMLAVSWSQNFASINTAIDAFNVNNSNLINGIQITFSLGTSAGANNLGSIGVLINANTNLADVPLFTGLSLASGTYFLTASAAGSDGGIWHGGTLAGLSAPGASFGDDLFTFNGAANFYNLGERGLGYQVSNDISSVPEPATFVLLSLGLGVIGYIRRRT